MQTRFTALLVATLAFAAAAQAEPAKQAAANSAPAATVTTAAATTTAAAAVVSAQPRQRTRAEVIAEVVEARRNGTLIETEADLDVAQTRKQIAR